MAAAWFSLKKSVKCMPELSDVQDPERTRKPCLCRSGCSRSIKDVIHGSKRHRDKTPVDIPRSVCSTDILNPITHHVVISDSKCELKITRFRDKDSSSKVYSKPRRSLDAGSQSFVCQICDEKFKKFEDIEVHHLSRHAVTALPEGDSSKKIVELICQATDLGSEDKFGQIEVILKANNMQTSLADFEDYREIVKDKANKLSKKHPRCLADGNELLMFHGTTVACFIGKKNSPSLCRLEKCGVCQILRNWFPIKKHSNGLRGVFTSSSSKRALECIELDEEKQNLRKALVVCRVIAGRVHKPLENLQEIAGLSNFDSLAGKVDSHSNKIEELFSLNPKALLPCFVVICKSP